MKRIFCLGLLVFAVNVFAECYIVDNVSGMEYNKRDNFRASEARLYKQPIKIILDGNNSSVSYDDLELVQIGKNVITGFYTNYNKTTVETWSLFPFEKKVLYIQTRNGFGEFDGSKTMIGDIVSECK